VTRGYLLLGDKGIESIPSQYVCLFVCLIQSGYSQ
jgi:hypothetical protein